jgi:hypothetical protein
LRIFDDWYSIPVHNQSSVAMLLSLPIWLAEVDLKKKDISNSN